MVPSSSFIRLVALLLGLPFRTKALRVLPQSEWAELVSELELNHSSLPFVQESGDGERWFNSTEWPKVDDSQDLAERHIPQMWQASDKTVAIRVPHEMVWKPDILVEYVHIIEYVYVRDQVDGSILYAAVCELGDTVVDITADLLGDLGGVIVPYAYCNVHGLWQGAPLSTVDPWSWNQTVDSLLELGQVEEQCEGSIYTLSPTHSLQLNLLDATGTSVQLIEHATYLQITFVFPRGQFLGLGFGESMLNADMVIAAELDGTPFCGDFFTRGSGSRYAGPELDIVQDVELVSAVMENGSVTLVCEKRLRWETDPDNQDKAFSKQYENLIWSFQNVASMPKAGSNSFLKRHAPTNRGYILEADLSGSGGRLAIAGNRDKRDLQVAHGMLMYMIWGINICVGAMIARYERHTAWWLGAHKIIQGINTVLTLPGYYLAQRFVDKHFQSSHAVLGTILVYTSLLQAGLGTSAYLCSKYSKRVTMSYSGAELSDGAESVFSKFKEMDNGPQELLHRLYHHLEELPEDLIVEIKTYVEKTVSSGIPFVPPRVIVFILTRVRQAFIRPVHRIIGRILPIVAYIQIYFGIDLLQVNRAVKDIITIWTVVIGVIIIYKECELQFSLPHGVGAKAKLLWSFVSACKRDISSTNQNQCSSKEQDDLNTGNDTELGESSQEVASSPHNRSIARQLSEIVQGPDNDNDETRQEGAHPSTAAVLGLNVCNYAEQRSSHVPKSSSMETVIKLSSRSLPERPRPTEAELVHHHTPPTPQSSVRDLLALDETSPSLASNQHKSFNQTARSRLRKPEDRNTSFIATVSISENNILQNSEALEDEDITNSRIEPLKGPSLNM
mmetsp:Transcript_16/g.62  ORF Transcript_16/g.62 Transcript_16/m.62 type:complete len:843 (+) Transcript_16:364-2892(+)